LRARGFEAPGTLGVIQRGLEHLFGHPAILEYPAGTENVFNVEKIFPVWTLTSPLKVDLMKRAGVRPTASPQRPARRAGPSCIHLVLRLF
jgi:hypothetical protein